MQPLTPKEIKYTPTGCRHIIILWTHSGCFHTHRTWNNCCYAGQGHLKDNTGVKNLLDYCASHLGVKLHCQASDIIFKCHSDASYPSKSKVCSRAAGYFYLGSENGDPTKPTKPILVLVTIIKNVMSAAFEAETAAGGYSSQELIGGNGPPTGMDNNRH